MDRHRDSRRQIPRLDPGTLLNQCRLINKETQTIRPYGLRRERHLHKTKKHCSKTSGWQEGGKRDSCVFSEMLHISRDWALLRCLPGSAGRGCVKVAEPPSYRLTSCSNIRCNSILLPESYQPTSLVCTVLSTLPALSKAPALSKQMKRGAPSTRAPFTHAHRSRAS